MSLRAAAIVPHSPLLIPEIGKENLLKLKKTEEALAKIEKIFIKNKIETIIIISPHGTGQENNFAINLSQTYKSNFEDFGNFSIKKEYNPNLKLIHKIRQRLENQLPTQLITEENLDHGTSIPLFLLADNLPNLKIVPIYYSGLSYQEHFQFGQEIKEEILKSNERIAVIASGDFSHRLNNNSPIGYSPRGKKFDKKILDAITNKDVPKLLTLDPELVIEAHECGLKSLISLLGMLDQINYTPEIMSYEHPFGIGYLVANLNIKK
jgi:AmmeMemoRadiSam system protein B